MGEVLVQASGLAKSYAGVPVVAGVTCRVMAGARIAVVGAAGRGKSTLLHLLGGLIEATEGQITWPALSARETLRPTQLAFAFQAQSLFAALTIQRNVALPLLLAGEPDAEARALAMLERFGLAGLARNLPEDVSGGQAQRVALARALVIHPRLVLADEPTGQLDSATAGQVLDTLLAVAAEHRIALVIATHDPGVAARMDQCWTMEHGALSVQAMKEVA